MKVPKSTESVYYVKNPLLIEYLNKVKDPDNLNPESGKTSAESKLADKPNRKREQLPTEIEDEAALKR